MDLLPQLSTLIKKLVFRDTGIIKRQKPSVTFEINNSHSAQHLLRILSERTDDIVADNEALAHLRIRTSHYLLEYIVFVIHRLDSHALYYRSESESLRQSLSGVFIRYSFSSSALSRAEYYDDIRNVIERIVDAICQFIGLHMQTGHSIRIALRESRQDDLARAIVTSCRQVSSFHHAISQAISATNLPQNIQDVVRTSISATRRDVSDQAHLAGQLGQFWNQGGSSGAKRFGAHDVRHTIQIIQRELADLQNMLPRLTRVCERDLARPYNVQRHPVRYSGLAAAIGASTRSLVRNAAYFGGNGSLEESIVQYGKVFRGFLSNKIIEPVSHFYKQVFHTSTTTSDEKSVIDSRGVLQEMLIEFTDKHLTNVDGAAKLAKEGDFKAVTKLILEQARHPFRNTFAGSLGQAILLQVQKLKCDVEELMLKSMQLLRAQELNLALVALAPSLLTIASIIQVTSIVAFYLRSRGTTMIVSGGQTARFLLGDVHSAFLAIEAEEDTKSRSIEKLLRYMKHIGVIHVKVVEVQNLIRLGILKAPEQVVFRFKDDLELLRSADVHINRRRKLIDRMLRCYSFLNNM
ncbi:Protein DGS1, mitochondrial [Gracilariopsis chorda]|uniref:Protein DGS1, mitochondrial n=1 Tax=Gracilariopsis chorda TaxID=448386 RepID=A0A2V3ISZ1_9FLOR|nr:Protein DGS1, mitochondrial [Gracilariopsis chorda]|eukprot:PXF45248.1 Protein DGS1, mitochondrial [Gracilariopsis chorda]